jgi:putative glutamine amidotransferase
MTLKNTPPIVWLPADHRNMAYEDGNLPYLMLGHKYADAAKRGANAQPVVFALAGSEDIDNLINQVDGVMLTGSPANVHPSHFGQGVADESLPLDPVRDSLTLPLVQACLKHGVPLLGICRGFQEINVALGGTLHQQVQNVPGKSDHREDKSQLVKDQYGLSHSIRLERGSVFAQWAGGETAQVNSLHGQGIDRLANELQPLAWADDGLVEAYAVKQASNFAYAMQWHPEWRFWETPFYAAVFKAFGEACRNYQSERLMRSQHQAHEVLMQ